jgi:hypothetical protein
MAEAFAVHQESDIVFSVEPAPTASISALAVGEASMPIVVNNVLSWSMPVGAQYPIKQFDVILCGMQYETLSGFVTDLVLEGGRSESCDIDIIGHTMYGPVFYPTYVHDVNAIDWLTISESCTGYACTFTITRTNSNGIEFDLDMAVDDSTSPRNGETIKSQTVAGSTDDATFVVLVDQSTSYELVAHARSNGTYKYTFTAGASASPNARWTFGGVVAGDCSVDYGVGTAQATAVCQLELETIGDSECGAIPPRKEIVCTGTVEPTCENLSFSSFSAPTFPEDCNSVCDSGLPKRFPWCSAASATAGACIKVADISDAAKVHEATGWGLSSGGTWVSTTSKHMSCDFWCSVTVNSFVDDTWCLATEAVTGEDYLCRNNEVATAFDHFHRHHYQGEATADVYSMYGGAI